MSPGPDFLRIHDWIPHSRGNGPGVRAVVWVQGCTLACPGCFNPETHGRRSGRVITVDELFREVVALEGIQGVTLSGGEPLQQLRPVLALLRRIRAETDLSILIFTGFRWEEVQRMPHAAELQQLADVLIAGRYDVSRRTASGLIGSENKTVHFFTPRHSWADFDEVPEMEIIIGPDGETILSGIDPLRT